MVGFNYIRTPGQPVRPAIDRRGRNRRHHLVPRRTYRGFLRRPASPASWRTDGRANGTMGDLAPHMINAALALAGPIRSLMAEVETVHATAPAARSAMTTRAR
jgi:predicted dehydrogenase